MATQKADNYSNGFAKGTAWASVSNVAQQIINFIIYALLAKQLGPFEFGLVAIAVVFVDLLNFIGRMGLTEAIIQREKSNIIIESTAFWMCFIFGVLCGGALWIGSEPIASYFGYPLISEAIYWLVPVVIFHSLGTVPEAILQRKFNFKALGLRKLFATTAGGGVALIMVFNDYGAISLIVQQLISETILVVITWYVARWKPKLKFSLIEARRLLQMGSALATSSLLAMGNQRVVDIVIGRLLGAAPLGVLRMAWRGPEALQSLLMKPLIQVSLPLFSSMQRDLNVLSNSYIKLSSLTAILVYPFFIGLIIIAPEFIILMFGERWTSSVPVMQVLCLNVLTMPLIWFRGNILIALGYSRLVLLLNLAEFILSVVVVVISCKFGLMGVAWGNVLRVLLILYPTLWVLQKYAGVDWLRLLKSNFPGLFSVAIMFFFCCIVRASLDPDTNNFIKMAALVGSGVISYLACIVFLFKSALDPIYEYIPGFISKYFIGRRLDPGK